MTRKDFQMVADVVSNIGDSKTRNEVALNFVHRLLNVNGRFDTTRFLKACKVSENSNDDDVHSFDKERWIAP